MKTFFTALVISFFSTLHFAYGQTAAIDKVQFFNDSSPLNATLVTDMGRLFGQKMKVGVIFPAKFICTLPDSTKVNEQIQMEVRGHLRREYCLVPPLKLKFNNKTSPILSPLNSLKLVNPCKSLNNYNQYLLKEFLAYKIYNLITDKSFHVRLVNLNWEDSSKSKKNVFQQAFLLEDVKDLATRNKCTESKLEKLDMESTDRSQMTIAALFEYMIGNTDWSVAAGHNFKLIQPEGDNYARPFAVPYDFDYSGLVNAEYAVPDQWLNIENVQQRVYRGFPRTMDELNAALTIFKQQKENIYALINNFNLLTSSGKKEMISYLEEFYQIIGNPNLVKSKFIDNARRE